MSDIGADTAGGAGIGAALGGPLGAGIGAGVGAIGGGLMDFFGQQSANTSNFNDMVWAENWASQQTASAEQYNTYMANTSHQREEADLKAAGLNPILAANSGAPSPTASPVSAPGAAPMQNTMRGLGSAVGGVMNSALSAAGAVKDMANTNADTTLKQAQALTEVTSQRRNTSSAAAAEASIPGILARSKQLEAETPAVANKARLDLENDARDRLINQIKNGAQAAASASDAVTSFLPSKSISTVLKGGYNANDMLNAAKGKGVLLP